MDKEILIEELISKGWFVRENFLDADFCQQLLTDMHANPFKTAAVGNGTATQIDHRIRTDEISWLDEDNCTGTQKAFFNLMNSIKDDVNRAFFLGIKRYECHYAHYFNQGFYKKHLDQHQNSPYRVLTTVTYLNTPKSGGELIIYSRDDKNIQEAVVKPQTGTFVCFLSNQIYHEVLPTNDDRYSLTGWYRSDVN